MGEEGDDDLGPVAVLPAIEPQHSPADVKDDQNVGCKG